MEKVVFAVGVVLLLTIGIGVYVFTEKLTEIENKITAIGQDAVAILQKHGQNDVPILVKLDQIARQQQNLESRLENIQTKLNDLEQQQAKTYAAPIETQDYSIISGLNGVSVMGKYPLCSVSNDGMSCFIQENSVWRVVNGYSMAPTLLPGDILFCHPKTSLIPGHIYEFRLQNENITTTHRCVEVADNKCMMKGDNNIIADGWVASEDILNDCQAKFRYFN